MADKKNQASVAPVTAEEQVATETALASATRVVEGIRSYGDVRGWRSNLTPDVAGTLARAEEYAEANPDSDASSSAQVRLAETAADLDRREADFLKGHLAQQKEIAATIEAQEKATDE